MLVCTGEVLRVFYSGAWMGRVECLCESTRPFYLQRFCQLQGGNVSIIFTFSHKQVIICCTLQEDIMAHAASGFSERSGPPQTNRIFGEQLPLSGAARALTLYKHGIALDEKHKNRLKLGVEVLSMPEGDPNTLDYIVDNPDYLSAMIQLFPAEEGKEKETRDDVIERIQGQVSRVATFTGQVITRRESQDLPEDVINELDAVRSIFYAAHELSRKGNLFGKAEASHYAVN